jgi:hypothetical protein
LAQKISRDDWWANLATVGEPAVFVNGAPGAGKTTLARLLRTELDIPLISRDAIKESLAEILGVPLPTSTLGAIASDAMWALVGAIDGPVIVESFWFTGRDDAFFRRGLKVGRVQSGVEVWCEAPVHIMRRRYLTRTRHFAHTDIDRLEDWETFAKDSAPISTFPTIRVDSTERVDVRAIANEVRRVLSL